MKFMRMLVTSIVGVVVIALLPLGAAELTFDLQTHPTAVALQFDVASTGAESVDLISPQLLVESAHVIGHNLVASGATRYLVYSNTGAVISPEGKLRVTFQSERPLVDGMLSITRIIASDRRGRMVGSAPNAQPVLRQPSPIRVDASVGRPTFLNAPVADLDGAIASIDFRLGGISRGIVSALPFRFIWTPDTEGNFSYVVQARDDAGAVVLLDVGNVEVGPPTQVEEGSFEAFMYFYYGEDSDPSWYTVSADPLQSGVPNGIAYLLDIDPHQPEHERLPQTSLEVIGGESYFTIRFARLSEIDGIQWRVRQSPTLRTNWTIVPSSQITEQAMGNGFTDVIVRVPVEEADPSKLFLQLQVTP